MPIGTLTRNKLGPRFRAGTRRGIRRMQPNSASPLPDLREPLDILENGIAVETLSRMDDAIDSGDLDRATHLERLLAPDMFGEPPVIDRLATVRLLVGDIDGAASLLGACPLSTPRLDLLRAIVALRHDDMLSAYSIANGETARRSLCLRIIAAIVAGLTAWEQGIRVGADTTAAVCEATREGAEATSGVGPAALTPALRTLGTLLPDAPQGTFLHAIRMALAGIAEDLGIPLPVGVGTGGPLGGDVSAKDRDGLNRRAA
jgi:hypothetical protein